MPTSLNLKIVKNASEQDAQKIATINAGVDDLDASLSGILTLSVAGSANVTLTRTQALRRVMKFTGVLTGSITVFLPVSVGTVRDPLIWNTTTGAFSLTIKTTTGGSTGIAVAQGNIAHLFHDDTNVWRVTSDRAIP